MTGSFKRPHGFTLVELLIGMALAALLTAGVSQLTLATARSFHAQQSLGALQENARLAFTAVGEEVRSAGFRQEPWRSETAIPAIGPETRDGFTTRSDRLVLRRWSDRNCFDNPNPELDGAGRPRFDLRETGFTLGASDNLAVTCRYGPSADALITQVNNMGLAQNAEAFQVAFAEDFDGDGNADRWVRAGGWDAQQGIMAIRLALLLATPEPVGDDDTGALLVLDEQIPTPADGRKRRVFDATFAIGGRAK